MRGYGPLCTGLMLGACAFIAPLMFDGSSMAPATGWGSPKAPKNPTMAHVRNVATAYEMRMLRKTAECELAYPGAG